MPTALSPSSLSALLVPYVERDLAAPENLYTQLGSYLDLLLKWNARTNLTAIRDPEEIVRRHFGESLFVARHLRDCPELLDFGSGAGFPGLPIQLFLPALRVTLAESQNKKAAFLREAIRTLNLKTEVWAGRVEAMPPRVFDTVTLRAVDNMESAIAAAAPRASKRIALMISGRQPVPLISGFDPESSWTIPGQADLRLLLLRRLAASIA